MANHSMADVQVGSAEPVDNHRTRTRTPVPFRRLLVVETRKLFDTRGGMVTTGILIILVLAAIIGRGVVAGPALRTLVGTAGVGLGTLLPVLGILTVTSEWSSRTALTTFTLEPRRGRVLAAKCLPPLITAVAASLFAIAVAVLVTAAVAAVRDIPADWQVDPLVLLGWTATNVLGVAMALALAMLLLNAPAAIVLSLSSTMLWTVVGKLGAPGALLAEWLDLGASTAALTAGDMTGGDAARIAVSIVFSIVLPMTAGAVRVVRREVT